MVGDNRVRSWFFQLFSHKVHKNVNPQDLTNSLRFLVPYFPYKLVTIVAKSTQISLTVTPPLSLTDSLK